jgi:hypothetical protein
MRSQVKQLHVITQLRIQEIEELLSRPVEKME